MIQEGVLHTENDWLQHASVNTAKAIAIIKKCTWLYFFLLIFEGALRKWIVPGLSTPLLIVRDPVAFIILFTAIRNRLFPANIYAYGIILIGIFCFFTAIFFGHGNLFVALFGARILILHFPLMFVIGKVFERKDIIVLGRVMLIMAPFMTVLIALQFFSPQSAWVNRGVGGNIEGAGFSGALGYFRPPGTFSFTNGTTLFYSMLAPFILYFWFNRRQVSLLILIAATLSLLAAIPLSISRSLFFSVIASCFFLIIVLIRQPRNWISILIIAFGIAILLVALSNIPFFNTATQAFTSRFTTANKIEGGVKGVIGDRYLGGMIGALTDNSSTFPFWGHGLGMGTNVGSMLLTGENKFLISEGEWGRLIGEMGLISGLFAIFFRVMLSVKMFVYSFKKLRYNEILPWLLISFGIFQIPQGQWAQPTSLGFAILIGGLILSALRSEDSQN